MVKTTSLLKTPAPVIGPMLVCMFQVEKPLSPKLTTSPDVVTVKPARLEPLFTKVAVWLFTAAWP